MENNQPNNKRQHQIEETLSMRNELEKYLYHWKWFVLSVFSALIVAFFYLRYATPKYEVETSLLIKQDDNMMGSELAAFQDMGLLGSGNSNIQNEIQLLKSRTLARSVAKDLNLTTRYFRQGTLKESEAYAETNSHSFARRSLQILPQKKWTPLFMCNSIRPHISTFWMPTKPKFFDSLEYNSSFAIKDRSYSIVQNQYFSENDFGKEIRIHLKPLERVVS